MGKKEKAKIQLSLKEYVRMWIVMGMKFLKAYIL